MTSSRLERLFVLIETGSSPLTKKAASQQLGEVVKLHPHELPHLLNRIFELLSSSSWDTRIAAIQAIEAICLNTPEWVPAEKIKSVERLYCPQRLSFNTFDIRFVIINSNPLMASDNLDYGFHSDEEDKELVQKQVDFINGQLNMGVNVENIISDADIAVSLKNAKTEAKNKKKLVNEVLNLNCEGLTCREINRFKRKTRISSSRQCDEFSGTSDSAETFSEKNSVNDKRIKMEESEDSTKSSSYYIDEELDWPFELFTVRLKQNLFSPKWEVRHGAAAALREIIKVHGKTCGFSADVEKAQMLENHQLWLEDLSLHLLCVLALDRFGDFISDQVVAPVRETCAQCLGIVINLMDENRVLQVVSILMHLLKENDWEIRHGALLGIKYILAVREDLQESILVKVFPLISNCFGDPIDDVSAEAACALNPVCDKIIRLMPNSVPILIDQLWKLLSSQDELGVACNSFMALLASIFMNSNAQAVVSSDMIIKIIPYLWTFLYYNASSVRKSAVQTICSVTDSKLCIGRWNESLLLNTMRHIYQRILLESTNEIRILAEQAWCNIVRNADLSILRKISWQYFGIWICLAMQSAKMPYDDSLFIFEQNKQIQKNEFSESDSTELKLYLGGNETVLPEIRESNVVYIRCMVTRLLGLLLNHVTKSVPEGSSQLPESSVLCYCNILLTHLNSKSALQRMISALVVNEWAQLVKDGENVFPAHLKDRLQQCLLESIYFDEIAVSYTKILQDTRDYILLLKNYGIGVDETLCNKVLRLNEIETLSSEKTFEAMTNVKLSKKVLTDLKDKRQTIYSTVCSVSAEQTTLTITTQAVIAGSVLTLKCLPNKLNPIIKPLMDAVKKEESEHLQKMAARHLARLVHCCTDREPSPNVKIVMNLCSFLCSDSEFTPQIHSHDCKNKNGINCNCDKYNGILTLTNQQKVCERIFMLKKMNSSNSLRSTNRTPLMDSAEENASQQTMSQKTNTIQRQGATYALIRLVEMLEEQLPAKVPILWNYLYSSIKDVEPSLSSDTDLLKDKDDIAEKLVSSLQVFEVLCLHIHDKLLPQITSLLNTLGMILNYPYCAVRHMAARCIAVLGKRNVIAVMGKIPTLILPFVNSADAVIKRQGGVEAIASLVDNLKLEIVPYIVLFIIPLLGRMSDQDSCVRSMASHAFGMLIQLMPLETAAPSPPQLPPELMETVEEQRSFLNQLLNPKCIPDFKLSIKINAELRSYQQCGVNWLAFLNKYQLHGILCDDMGLGKTLQSLCILAEDHYRREVKSKESGTDVISLPSLVICPPTLIGHWVYEIKKFIPNKYLKPLQYEGIPSERERLRSIAPQYNLIVASYDIVRKDCDFFSNMKWNYCILDEGHIIKNGKTKISIAVKKLVVNRRLILSGTPIQNNVLELWSLFDFLMPGYLGNEKQFNTKFSKPILCSRDPKSSVKEQEAGIMAMEALHQKVLPFILRRMKGDVLKDLPPKITQDYYCDLSPIQQKLYEDFSKSEIQKNTINAIKSQSCNSFSMFQALRYLQSVCNHPKLVLTREHPLHDEIISQLEAEKSSLSDIKHAAKLIALKQLLIDCGIGGAAEVDDVTKSSCIVSQHRALIFCQLKAMLNILETDFFQKHLPNVTYLRLDGSVSSKERHKIVTSFNEDPSIDVLLLTTQIGGLGLNLTGADTVIFVEHDWNPMKDLQAMDRAHRIGQKKVVNVYRLITRATLEQKIMGLQEFKLKTANTVITAENSSLTTMSTEKLLDLFALNTSGEDKKESADAESSKRTNSANEYMKSLPELWDTKDYEEEYDMSSFINSLKH